MLPDVYLFQQYYCDLLISYCLHVFQTIIVLGGKWSLFDKGKGICYIHGPEAFILGTPIHKDVC